MPPEPARVSRSEAKNAAVRDRLEPLRPGERPPAVTIGALVALALAVTNIAFYAAGAEIDGKRPAFSAIGSYTVILLALAWGMWNAKYLAVLAMQALLGILILIFAILAIYAANAAAVAVCVVVIAAAGTLFWFLVKALARIQMPERR
ncbi:MAG TPA: hypothetical protein VF752_12390 [Thermoleophilaceae bacterium]